jgi:3-hydroxybutyryl-CoA dehydrogenase
MKVVFILGAGTMGRGIAQVVAQAGLTVYLSDISLDAVEKSLLLIKSSLDKQMAKGIIVQTEADAIMGRIMAVKGMERIEDADCVIEAALEDVVLKKEIFRELDKRTSPQAILATNTTACSITQIASATTTQSRVVGMHFFNPPTIMNLIEIMPGMLTSDETVKRAADLALLLGKEPVIINKEGPAGVTSRILAGLLNEAVWVLHEGIATVDAIDRAMVLGCNHKIGPFSLIDLIGVDIHLAKTQMLYKKTGDARYRPCYILEQMVEAGLLGKKAGKGFYDYTKVPTQPSSFFHNQELQV